MYGGKIALHKTCLLYTSEQDIGYGVISGYLRSEDFRGQADRDTRKGEPVYQKQGLASGSVPQYLSLIHIFNMQALELLEKAGAFEAWPEVLKPIMVRTAGDIPKP